ncbi:MAG: glutamyl-tRNA reductase [Gammaproteobacteria bacterium]
MLLVVGVSHKTAPLELRERVAIAPERVPELLDDLLENDGVDEAVLLVTCNRTELYVSAAPQAQPLLVRWLGRISGLGVALDTHLYVHQDTAAARHLFRVAAGLDSLVVGETQILAQIKTAYRQAHREAAAVGPELHQLFQHALGLAKHLRTDSALDSLRSLPYAAAKLAASRFEQPAACNAVLVGAGTTIDTLAFHLRKQGVRRLTILNRSLPAATALAARHEATADTLDVLPAALAAADLVVCATTSDHVLIGPEQLAERIGGLPLFIIDLAVPRDVSPDVAALPDIELVTVDDLATVVNASVEMRFAAAAEAEQTVETALGDWRKTRRIRTAVPTICALRAEAARTRRHTLVEARRIAASRGTEAALDYLATTLTNRLLHAPTVRLRDAAAAENRELLAAARELFALDDDEQAQGDIEAA